MSEQELNNPDVSTGPDPIVPPQPEPEPVPDDDMASLVVVDGVERTIPGKDDDLDDDMLVDLGDDQEDVEARLKRFRLKSRRYGLKRRACNCTWKRSRKGSLFIQENQSNLFVINEASEEKKEVDK